MWILRVHVYTVTCFIHYETLCWTMFYMYLLWARVEYPGWPWVKLCNGVLLELFWISGGFENFHEPKTGWWCDYIYMSVIPETWHCDTIRKDVNWRRQPVWDHPSHGNILARLWCQDPLGVCTVPLFLEFFQNGLLTIRNNKYA